MIDAPSIQWFPGHMAKTRRLIGESLSLVDLVIELTDARIPQSSRNPELDKWLSDKPRIIILNKSDCADENITKQWVEYYKKKGIRAVMADCKSGKGVAGIIPAVKAELTELLERRAAKGIAGKPIRVMVVGIPNVGKSSLINKLAGSKRAKVEDRPGVTRGRQWVKISNELELLDMPGVLWPKFEDQTVGEHLAFTGAVKDDVIDIELLAMRLLQLLNRDYPQLLQERYKVEAAEDTEAYELLTMVGRKRGMLISGGEVNTERAAITVLDEYRSGKLGRISLEKPPKAE
ncbi:MAG: ribosome biogenesis GTPase YlqF [Clostridiales bacterium]|nr:ribosome biogenesis GTPase YlqF [Clostridiales bacterium]